jgi:hypothetical protein
MYTHTYDCTHIHIYSYKMIIIKLLVEFQAHFIGCAGSTKFVLVHAHCTIGDYGLFELFIMF